MRSLVGIAILTLLLSGCTNLPVGGPQARDVSRGAAATLTAGRYETAYDYVLVDVTNQVVENAIDVSLGSFYQSFGLNPTPAPPVRIGEGDVVQITIFESAVGGLFIPPEAGVRPGNFVTLPPQTIGKAGTVSVPYAGEIPVAGRTIQQVQKDIEKKLGTRAVEPQVVVSISEQTAMAITVVGESASRIQLRPNERVLDIIAKTGGNKYPGHEMFVTLLRDGKKATIYFPNLINDPKENIFVQAGDTIYLYREPQRFIAIGALSATGQTSGVTGFYSFDQEKLSLHEAIAKAGGLSDGRANASEVYVYRLEYREVLERIGVDTKKFPADQKVIPTIYRANFRDPSAFFLADRFPMRHRDAIYVPNADSVELEKFLFHTQAITGTISTVTGDAVATRGNIRSLAH